MVAITKYLNSLIILTFLLFSLTCCDDLDKDGIKEKQLTLWGRYESNSSLKMEGAFVSNKCIDYSELQSIYILYNNGILYGGSGTCMPEDKDPIDYISEMKRDESRGDKVSNWGCFDLTSDNIIHIQYFGYQGPKLQDAPVIEEKGVIINDSTFVMKYYKGSASKAKFEDVEERTYRFVSLDNKPDSSNYLLEILGSP